MRPSIIGVHPVEYSQVPFRELVFRGREFLPVGFSFRVFGKFSSESSGEGSSRGCLQGRPSSSSPASASCSESCKRFRLAPAGGEMDAGVEERWTGWGAFGWPVSSCRLLFSAVVEVARGVIGMEREKCNAQCSSVYNNSRDGSDRQKQALILACAGRHVLAQGIY